VPATLDGSPGQLPHEPAHECFCFGMHDKVRLEAGIVDAQLDVACIDYEPEVSILARLVDEIELHGHMPRG
jgi:hypothetical protein